MFSFGSASEKFLRMTFLIEGFADGKHISHLLLKSESSLQRRLSLRN